MKRVLTLLVALLMLASMLAACGEQAATTPTTPATGGTEQTPATQPTEAAEQPTEAAEQPTEAAEQPTEGDDVPVGEMPDDPIGVLEVREGDPIAIGAILILSGPNVTLGEDARRGIEIAIKDRNEEFLGHPLQLVAEDGLCSPDGGQTAASRLASNQEIVAVIGTSCSSAARVANPILDQAGFLIVSPSATAPSLTAPGERVEGFFRTAHNDKVQGRVAAEYAFNELKLTKAATVHDGSPYAQGLAESFANAFADLGGEVVAQEAVGDQDTDMRPVLTRMASKQPEIIYYPIFTTAGGFMTRQAKEVSGLENVTLMGADGIFSPDFLEAAGEAAVGMYHTSPDFSAFGGGYNDFLEKHQEAYGEAPLSAFHAHAYDATNLILRAIQEVSVRGEDGTLYIPRAALREALMNTQNYQGLTGNLTCNEAIESVKDPGDCADPKIAVYETVNADPASWNPGAADDSNPKKVYP